MNRKVLFVISSLGGGGAERVLGYIANQMINDELKVKILKTGSKKNHDYSLSDEIEIIQMPKTTGNLLKRGFQMLINMRRVMLLHEDYTIVSFLSDNNMLSILSSIGLKNRVVVCERNDPNQNCGNELLRQIRNFLYLFADWNVFQTEDAKAYFCRSIQKKGTIIPNPVIMKECTDSNLLVKNEILAAGRLTEQKNYPMVIKAFSSFSKIHSEYILNIYGDGPLKEQILKIIEHEGLQNKVFLKGFTDQLHERMKECRMYVSSSDYEGISNTMLEAMALGVPTIVTDCPVGGARMVISSMQNGIMVPVGDSSALCDAMLKVANDEKFEKFLRENSVKIKETFSIEKITKQWEDIL